MVCGAVARLLRGGRALREGIGGANRGGSHLVERSGRSPRRTPLRCVPIAKPAGAATSPATVTPDQLACHGDDAHVIGSGPPRPPRCRCADRRTMTEDATPRVPPVPIVHRVDAVRRRPRQVQQKMIPVPTAILEMMTASWVAPSSPRFIGAQQVRRTQR
jgi:hypothetical protein